MEKIQNYSILGALDFYMSQKKKKKKGEGNLGPSL
jgi:hypothetical protein